MNIGAVVGRLTKDMEFIPYENKTTGKKGYRARGTVAVEREGRVDKNGQKEVDFIPVQSWISEIQHEKFFSVYMKKGASVSVNGSIRVENYKDKNNQDRTFTVVEGRMSLVSSPRNNNEGTNMNSQGNQGFQDSQRNQSFQDNQTYQQQPETSYQSNDFQALADEDIPF